MRLSAGQAVFCLMNFFRDSEIDTGVGGGGWGGDLVFKTLFLQLIFLKLEQFPYFNPVVGLRHTECIKIGIMTDTQLISHLDTLDEFLILLLR